MVRSGRTRLCRIVQVEEQPLPLPLFRHERDAGAARPRAATWRLIGSPSTRMVPASRREQPEDRFQQFGAAGTHEAEQPDDLAGVDLQRDVAKAGTAAQRRRRRAPPGGRPSAALLSTTARGGSSRPTIARTTSIRRDAAAIERLHVGAVAQHRDPIAEAEHFRQPVRHVEQRRLRAPSASRARRTGDPSRHRSATSSARRARGSGSRTRAPARPGAAAGTRPTEKPPARPGEIGRCSSSSSARVRSRIGCVAQPSAAGDLAPAKMLPVTVRFSKQSISW